MKPCVEMPLKIHTIFVLCSACICLVLVLAARHHPPSRRKIKEIWHGRVHWEEDSKTTMLRSSPEKALENVEPSNDISKPPEQKTGTKPMIAICAATHSKSNWRSLDDTALEKLLIPSIQRTISSADRSQYDFRLYLAADHDDQFWLNNQNNVKTPDWLSVQIGFYEVPEQKIPFNPMMRAAFNDGAEYLVRINDDSEFVTSDWVSKAVAKLATYDPPNVGMVGPNCREGNTAIMTHDMVHRTHLDIFEHYYPDVFSAWWIDDWISKVYGPQRSTKMMDWTVKHHIHKHGTRYKVQGHEAKLLKGELKKGAGKIETWLNDNLQPTRNSKEIAREEPSKEYIPPNDPLDAFLRKYLAQECLQLDDCKSVRNFEGYNLLNAHQQGQAVMTRILKAFSMLFEKLNIKWIPVGGTMLGILRHNGWIPWDGDMDIFMAAEDTHKVANHLHLLPNDLSMVHPLVDGATMGRGIYKGMCSASNGFGFDPITGKGVGSLDCSLTNRWKPSGCLYASLRDLNSCRPGTNNIVNGLSIDIFVIPRNEECGDEYFRNALNAPREYGTFHGWRIPIPVNPHQFLNQNKWHNYGKKEDYMRIIPKWGKYKDPEPNHICPNWRNVIHKQPIVETSEHLFVRQQSDGDDQHEKKESKTPEHFFTYFDEKMCHPGYTGILCDERLIPANPWYTTQCPNLLQENTFNMDMVTDNTKSFGVKGCRPGNSFGLPLSYCASLCFSHPKYGISVIPTYIWKMAQRAEGSLWKKSSSNHDRAPEHLKAFRQFKIEMPDDLGSVIEVGAGPWTQTRGILNTRPTFRVSKFTIYEPGANFYKKNVRTCAYKTDKLLKFNRQGYHSFPLDVISSGGETLTSWTARYDTLVSINVIEHVQNAFDFLEGLWTVLKPGGILIFHERYCMTPEQCDGVLGRNLYHPIRISKYVLDTFIDKFDTIYMNDNPSWGGRKYGEKGYYFVGRKKLTSSSKQVISYSLYGSNPRYTDGALENAKLMKKIYPEWTMRVYYDDTVPHNIIEQLRQEDVQLVDMTGSDINKMSWRFQAAVDSARFCARDIDSRLSEREAVAVKEWLESGKHFHVMRDHPSHSKYPMSGGMWCSTTIPNIKKLLTDVKNNAYLQDMDFLNKVIWPMAQKSLLQHDSFSCHKFGGGKPFPTPRVGWEHVGSVYINGKMRQKDVDILKQSGAKGQCNSHKSEANDLPFLLQDSIDNYDADGKSKNVRFYQNTPV